MAAGFPHNEITRENTLAHETMSLWLGKGFTLEEYARGEALGHPSPLMIADTSRNGDTRFVAMGSLSYVDPV